MKQDIKLHLKKLKLILNDYNISATLEKEKLLKLLSQSTLQINTLIDYHDCLLFLVAYPDNASQLKLVLKELNRIAIFIKQLPANKKANLCDSGLPFTEMITRFSCDILTEMLNKYACQIKIDSFEESGEELNTLLNITLPTVLKQETTAGLENMALLDFLGVKPNQRLLFLLNEFNKLEKYPLIKDHLWESLKIYLNISSNSKTYSRTFNRIDSGATFYHDELIKKFDHHELLKRKLPKASQLDETSQQKLVDTIRKSLLLTMRETDTSTFMDTSSIELFHLERGVSIALYALKANRQLAYQSYIGYTAFKNGYPVAYGGSWVFGYGAMFGLNILESFRGGESGYLMCQLLRTYMQRYQLSYIEIENYQFGKDNPDGIKSGAFWFYYRYGFRPISPELKQLAEKEFNKIKNTKGYRSSEKVLIALSESNIALNTGIRIPVKKEEIFAKVLQMIVKRFGGDNISASQTAIAEFEKKIGVSNLLLSFDESTVEEISLWAKAYKISKPDVLQIMYRMLAVKTNDAYAYNALVKQLFSRYD